MNKKKLVLMVAGVGFAASVFAGCELEPVEDTVTVDVGTPAIEENVDADDDEDPLPTEPDEGIGDGGELVSSGAWMRMALHEQGFGYLSDQITEDFATEFIELTCDALSVGTTAAEYQYFFLSLVDESDLMLDEVVALVAAAAMTYGPDSECWADYERVTALISAEA